MRNLIITADDYGMCPPVNQAIEECMKTGAIRSTCVMTNMPYFPEARSLRAKFPGSSIGIHWTLTDGQPVLPGTQVKSLVGEEGDFHSAPELRRRWLKRMISPDEVNAELEAQYRRFAGTVGSPDYWNTHENFHVLPGLFDLCVTKGLDLRIPVMRCHRRFTVPRTGTSVLYHAQRPVYTLKRWVIGRWSHRAQVKGMTMLDGMIHMPGYEMTLENLLEVVKRLPWPSLQRGIELVVHPATTSQDPLFRMQAEQRVQEYRLLSNPSILQQLSAAGIHLSSFESLRVAA